MHLTGTYWKRSPVSISHTGSCCCGDSSGDFIPTDTGVGYHSIEQCVGGCSRRCIGDRGRGPTINDWIEQSKWTSLTHSDSNSRVQAGSGSQLPLARQVIMDDPDILNPLLQE